MTDFAGQFFHSGAQYYVAGRAATALGLLPVPGNLFHHAIECFLKGDLCSGIAPADLKSIGHDLKRLWAAFKNKHADATLTAFDSRIDALHDFERIRYPDSIVKEGMYATISFTRWDRKPAEFRGTPPPEYHLVVQDIDELVGVIFAKARINPAFFFAPLSSEARSALFDDNKTFGPKDLQ